MRRSCLAFSLLVVLIAAVPVAIDNPYYIHLLTTIGIYSILLFGLDILVGHTGELSLGHAALFGIGAYAAGIASASHGWPIWATVPLAMVVTAAFGALLAFTSLRVSGPYLAMVTLAFGTVVQILINEMDFLTGGPIGITLTPPEVAGIAMDAIAIYYLVAAVLALSFVAVSRLLGSHAGRAFDALHGSPVACDCMGVSSYLYKVLAFVVSAVMAGLAGSLYAYSEQYIAPNAFGIDLAILFLLAVMLGGRRGRFGSITGAVIVVYLPNLLSSQSQVRVLAGLVSLLALYALVKVVRTQQATVNRLWLPAVMIGLFDFLAFFAQDMTEHRLTVFGLLILGTVYFMPEGIAGRLRKAAATLLPIAAPHASAARDAVPSAVDAVARPGGGGQDTLLSACEVLMQFGGLTALNRVDLQVRRGSIHGVIGPNGSGKSTLMNILTGVYRPTAGVVRLEGKALQGRAPTEIARRGVARTFQNVQLFGEMSVLENVLVGLHHSFSTQAAQAMLGTPTWRREEAAARRRAAALLDFVGLAAFADQEARHLPYGRQRMLEIGRALALDPQVLILDEPAAGLTPADIPLLMDVIRRVNAAGVTVVLIEHHMDIVMTLCDTVTVLDFGRKIAEGVPAEVRQHPKVIEAYLGTQATAPAAARPLGEGALAC